MAVLNIKDAQRLEVIRKYSASDPLFWSVDNRPIDDGEQRDKDLDRIFTPARGFRVRQTVPPSANVQIEPGVYVSSGVTVNQVALVTPYAIPAAGAADYRIDLIWFDMTTGLQRTAGSPQPVTFGAKPSMPVNNGGFPLAYVYVFGVATLFDETIAVGTAGAIEDCRLAPGAHGFIFESVAANIKIDAVGGGIGTSSKIVRADHQHNLNIDAVNPADLGPSVVATPGIANIYPRRDHAHAILTEAVAANLKIDSGTGVLGVLGTIVRADHQHPLNVDATVPVIDYAQPSLTAIASTAGTASAYARRDHVHGVPRTWPFKIGFWGGKSGGALVGGGTANYAIGIGSQDIPANTFPNGIILIAWAEYQVFNETNSNAEFCLDQSPWGGSKKQLSAQPTVLARGAVPIINGGLASLGAGAVYESTGCNDGEAYVVNTVTSIGVWAKNGTLNLSGIGGGADWDPTKATRLDFNLLYVSGVYAVVGKRGWYALGF
jgi:hypothetical protein